MRHNQMMLGIDRDLHVVADNARATLVAIERLSGSVSEICWLDEASICFS
jgi:hypothetical protein